MLGMYFLEIFFRPFIGLILVTAGTQAFAVVCFVRGISQGRKVKAGTAVVTIVAGQRLFLGRHFMKKPHVALGIGEFIVEWQFVQVT